MKKKQRDYVAKLQVYGLEEMNNSDIRWLMKWLKDISESKVMFDRMNSEGVVTYKLMK